MIGGFAGKAVYIIRHPLKGSDKYKNENYEEPFRYFIFLSLSLALFSGFFFTAVNVFPQNEIPEFTTSLFGMIYSAVLVSILVAFVIIFLLNCCFLCLIGTAMFVHFFAFLLGGREGFEKTMAATVYSLTPVFFPAFIVVVLFTMELFYIIDWFIMPMIVCFILYEIPAVKEYQNISALRAVFAVIVSVIFMIRIFLSNTSLLPFL